MTSNSKEDLRTWVEAPGWVDKMLHVAIRGCLDALQATDEPLPERDLARMHDRLKLVLRDLLVLRALNDQRQKIGSFVRDGDWTDGQEHLKGEDVAVWGLAITADEHATVKQAIVKVAEELPTELPGTALSRICAAYLGGEIAVAPFNLDDVIKAAGYFLVMGRLAVLYPDRFYYDVCIYDADDPFFCKIINECGFTAEQIETLYRQQLTCRLKLGRRR